MRPTFDQAESGDCGRGMLNYTIGRPREGSRRNEVGRLLGYNMLTSAATSGTTGLVLCETAHPQTRPRNEPKVTASHTVLVVTVYPRYESIAFLDTTGS